MAAARRRRPSFLPRQQQPRRAAKASSNWMPAQQIQEQPDWPTLCPSSGFQLAADSSSLVPRSRNGAAQRLLRRQSSAVGVQSARKSESCLPARFHIDTVDSHRGRAREMQRACNRLLRYEDFLDRRVNALRAQHLPHSIDCRLTISAFRNTKDLYQHECSFAPARVSSKTGQLLFLLLCLRSALHFRRPPASSASSFCSSRILERTSANFVFTSSLTSLHASSRFSRRSRICLTSRKEKPSLCILRMKLNRSTSARVCTTETGRASAGLPATTNCARKNGSHLR